MSKPRLSPTKSRRHSTRSRSPSQGTRARLISSFPTSKPAGRSTRPRSTNDELPRSSSCSDLSSLKSNLMQQEQARSVLDRLLNYLSRVRLLSQQIRTRSVHTINGSRTPPPLLASTIPSIQMPNLSSSGTNWKTNSPQRSPSRETTFNFSYP